MASQHCLLIEADKMTLFCRSGHLRDCLYRVQSQIESGCQQDPSSARYRFSQSHPKANAWSDKDDTNPGPLDAAFIAATQFQLASLDLEISQDDLILEGT